MPTEKQSRVKQLVPALYTRARTSKRWKKTAKIRRHQQDCHEEDGACSGAKNKVIITSLIPKMKHVTPYNWLEQWTKATDNERYEMCWDPHTAGGDPMLCPEDHFQKLYDGPFQESGQSRAFRSPSAADLLVAAGDAKELCHIGSAKYETVILEGGLVPDCCSQKKGRLVVYSMIVDTPRTKTGAAKTRRDLRCGHAGGKLSSTKRSTAALSASTQSPKYVKNVIHIRGTAENLLHDSRCSGTHTVEKDTRKRGVEEWQGYLPCKGFSGKDTLLEETLCALMENSTNKISTHSKPGISGLHKREESVKWTKRAQRESSKEQEEEAGASLQEGFACIQALTQLHFRHRTSRGNLYGQSRAQPQYGKARDHYQKAVTEGVTIGNKERRKCSSIAERWDVDQIYRTSLRQEGRTQ